MALAPQAPPLTWTVQREVAEGGEALVAKETPGDLLDPCGARTRDLGSICCSFGQLWAPWVLPMGQVEGGPVFPASFLTCFSLLATLWTSCWFTWGPRNRNLVDFSPGFLLASFGSEAHPCPATLNPRFRPDRPFSPRFYLYLRPYRREGRRAELRREGKHYYPSNSPALGTQSKAPLEDVARPGTFPRGAEPGLGRFP